MSTPCGAGSCSDAGAPRPAAMTNNPGKTPERGIVHRIPPDVEPDPRTVVDAPQGNAQGQPRDPRLCAWVHRVPTTIAQIQTETGRSEVEPAHPVPAARGKQAEQDHGRKRQQGPWIMRQQGGQQKQQTPTRTDAEKQVARQTRGRQRDRSTEVHSQLTGRPWAQIRVIMADSSGSSGTARPVNQASNSGSSLSNRRR